MQNGPTLRLRLRLHLRERYRPRVETRTMVGSSSLYFSTGLYRGRFQQR